MGTADGVCRGRRRPIRDRPANPIAAHADPLIYPGMEIIQRPPGKESLSCTLGFVDPAARVGVTAGHCGGNGPVFTSDGVRIGQLAVAQSTSSPRAAGADDYRIDYEGIAFDDGVPINNVLPNGLRLESIPPSCPGMACRYAGWESPPERPAGPSRDSATAGSSSTACPPSTGTPAVPCTPSPHRATRPS